MKNIETRHRAGRTRPVLEPDTYPIRSSEGWNCGVSPERASEYVQTSRRVRRATLGVNRAPVQQFWRGGPSLG